jgi:transcriptional regulator with XRE-family HTH domain
MTPVNAEMVHAEKRRAFCARLKSEREQRSLSLADIAQATKVNLSFLEALEHGDLSRWPRGEIYHRAFFRNYATAVGLPADRYTSEFLELFGEGEAGSSSSASVATAAPLTSNAVRLTLGEQATPVWFIRRLGHGRSPVGLEPGRVMAAAVDVATVLVAALLASWSMTISFWPTAATIALGYGTLSTLFFGQSVASWVLAQRRWDPVMSKADVATPGVFAPSALRDLVDPAFPPLSVLRKYIRRISHTNL